jgi:CheY-like chemotaxis protein
MMQLRILLVDDDPTVREVIGATLRMFGFETEAARDGDEALARMELKDFGAVITDHNMPGCGGLELVRALRARAYAGRIFVLSGSLSPEDRADYARLGVDGVAGKPLGVAELRGLLFAVRSGTSGGISAERSA